MVEQYNEDKFDDEPKVEKILDTFKAVENKDEVIEAGFVGTLEEIIKKENSSPEIKEKAKEVLYDLAED